MLDHMGCNNPRIFVAPSRKLRVAFTIPNKINFFDLARINSMTMIFGDKAFSVKVINNLDLIPPAFRSQWIM